MGRPARPCLDLLIIEVEGKLLPINDLLQLYFYVSDTIAGASCADSVVKNTLKKYFSHKLQINFQTVFQILFSITLEK